MGKHVQEEELQEKVDNTLTINTTRGLQGGGNLSANRTHGIADSVVPITSKQLGSDENLDDIKTPGFYYHKALAPTNTPYNGAGALNVYAVGSVIIQEWRQRDSDRIWTRRSNSSGSLSGVSWKEIAYRAWVLDKLAGVASGNLTITTSGTTVTFKQGGTTVGSINLANYVVTSYNDLTNKLTAGENIKISSNNEISSEAKEDVVVINQSSGTYNIPNKSAFYYIDDNASSTGTLTLVFPTTPTYGNKITIHKGRTTNNNININLGPTDGFITLEAFQKRQYRLVALPAPQDGKRYAISYQTTSD